MNYVSVKRYKQEKIRSPESGESYKARWVLVAHAYNPSYSGGRDQQNRVSKPVQAE
jgi:hypothetical protein